MNTDFEVDRVIDISDLDPEMVDDMWEPDYPEDPPIRWPEIDKESVQITEEF